jgi:O-antigen/teichoic acid export membrane protein
MEHEDVAGTEQAERSAPPESLAPSRFRSVSLKRGRALSLLRSRTAREAAGFAVASLLANVFAVVATALLTRNLTTAAFGSYSFAVSLLFFVALFFEFGLLVPAARLAAISDGRDRRQIIGAALLVYLPIGAAFSATIFVLSFWVDGWFHVEAADALRAAALPAVAFPFTLVLQQLAQGVDRLHVASVATVLAQLLLVALLGLWLSLGSGLSTVNALIFRSLALLIAGICSAVWLRPLFSAATAWSRELMRQSRQWGFHLFVGRVLSTGTYNMDVLMLGLWTSSRSVGMYVLAGSLATAGGLPVVGMAGALFARMAREPAIARRWLVTATVVGIACALATWLLAEPVIRVFFSARYLAATGLVLPLALAQLVRGVTGIFNTFLGAHGRGADLRNAGLVLTLSNLFFNFALIPPFGANGAAWASLVALVANLIAHVIVYRRSFAL